MIVVRTIEEVVRDQNSVVTVGSFDGVHLAHREIIREVVHRAHMREGRSVVVTFDPHPSVVVAPERGPVPLLTTIGERIELLRALQVDLICILEFTKEFSTLSSEEFYRTYIVDRIGVSEVVVGYDHMFGHRRKAGVHDLVAMGTNYDFSVFAAHPVKKDGEAVGSTLIRQLLLGGEVTRANNLLGYPYRLGGTVVAGDGMGKTLGFPTANLRINDPRKLIPARGVYFAGVRLVDRDYFGMLNIGLKPTLTKGDRETIEVHVFHLHEDLYGKQMELRVLRRLRDEQRFGSREELIDQLHRDREESERLMAEYQQGN